MMSKAAQSVPGPSHVAGNTSHRVIAATDPTTSAISTEVISPELQEEEEFELCLSSDDEDEVDVQEKKMKMAATLEKVRHWVQIRRKSFAPNITAPISEESFRIGCYLRTLDNALDDIIYVLDDKIRRGFPIEKRGRKGVN
ncbi:uncharacterized protein LOC118436593 isoform X2 [Folsomia candida]|uniref:uncharacterized protein LOC118436593 isoform X2 n=1 Tax=Folsomia candida TaxID=158441 RepID=UPI001604FA63|nr:uncharacterized protein LOC118436593 isoform X2 [Folsomia candida]